MNILVTGANGFLGSNIIRKLITSGHNVYALSKQEICLNHPNLFKIVCDLIDINYKLKGINIDVIFNTAARINFEHTENAYNQLTRDNILTTYNLADFAIKNKVKKIIHSSTCSVYSQHLYYNKQEINEYDQLNPVNLYATSKLVSEWILATKLKDIINELIILRYSSIYGEGQRKGSIIPTFIENAMNNFDINIYGSGNRVQDYVYIDDVVEANLKCLEQKVPFNTILNIGSGEKISDIELAEQIKNIWASDSKINVLNKLYEPEKYFYFDIRKAQKLLSYSPRILTDGLKLYKESQTF